MTYVRRGAIETNLGQNVVSPRSSVETTNTVNINNIVTRDIVLEDPEEAPASEPPTSVEDDLRLRPSEQPHKGYTSQELWTIPVLKRIINAINNAYFNTKLIDNIILHEDMEAILSAVTGKEVRIQLLEPSDNCGCLVKLNCIRSIAKIVVNDNGTQTNFKYVYNDVYEALQNDFRINMSKVFTQLDII